jgi:hypothetical protein
MPQAKRGGAGNRQGIKEMTTKKKNLWEATTYGMGASGIEPETGIRRPRPNQHPQDTHLFTPLPYNRGTARHCNRDSTYSLQKLHSTGKPQISTTFELKI